MLAFLHRKLQESSFYFSTPESCEQAILHRNRREQRSCFVATCDLHTENFHVSIGVERVVIQKKMLAIVMFTLHEYNRVIF